MTSFKASSAEIEAARLRARLILGKVTAEDALDELRLLVIEHGPDSGFSRLGDVLASVGAARDHVA